MYQTFIPCGTPIAYVYPPIFATITNQIWSMITEWLKLVRLLMLSFLYQAAYDWSMIKKSGTKFAGF
jgi:hypothetical protein